MSVKPVFSVALLAGLVIPLSVTRSQEPANLVGQSVIVISSDAELTADGKLLATLPAGELLRPKQAEDVWLLVSWEGEAGWVDRRHVLPVQAAIDHLSRSIQADSKNSVLYAARGAAWREKGELDISLADFNEAIRLDPANVAAYRGRALIWERKKQHDKAIADYSECLRLDGKFATAYYSRGWCRYQKNELDQALADVNEALKLKPKFVPPLELRGHIWERRSDYDKAIADDTEVIRLEPEKGSAYFSRGWNHFEKLEYEQALTDFTEAVRLVPRDPRPADHRRRALSALGRYAEVIADDEARLKAVPQDAAAHERLARLRATCPNSEFRDRKLAVQEALKACELTHYKAAAALDTLAAAYAESGQFDQAKNWQYRAVELAAPGAKKEFQARLDLYSRGRPLREDPVWKYPWESFTSTEGRFRVQFPGHPDERVERPEAEFHQHTSNVKTTSRLMFRVGYGDIPEGITIDPPGDTTLKTVLDRLAGDLKLLDERKLTLQDYPGLEKFLETPTGETFVFRGFLVGRRVYHLFIGGSTPRIRQNAAAIDRFLDSFVVIADATHGAPAEGPEAWKEFASHPGRFRVEFPPGKVEMLSEPKDGSGIYEFGLTLGTGVKFAAGYGDLKPEIQQQYPEAKPRLEALRDIMAAKTGSKIASDRDLTMFQFPGKEIVLEDKDGTTTVAVRMYMVYNRLYQCTVMAPTLRFKSDADVIRRFLQSFALLSLASEDGQLAMEEIEACYGPRGPVRQNRLYFPFDTIQYRARVLGLTLDPQGAPDFELVPSLIDEQGTRVFSDSIRIQTAPAGDLAGGTTFDIAIPVPPAAVPGEYSFVLILKDLKGEREARFLRKILIRPVELAIVSLEFFQDADEKLPGPAGGVPGRPFHVRLRAIGYDRSSDRLDTAMQMELFDEQGRQLFSPPLQLTIANDQPEMVRKSPFVTFSAKLTIDRPGRYRLLMTVQDKIGGKSTRLEVPVVMTAPAE